MFHDVYRDSKQFLHERPPKTYSQHIQKLDTIRAIGLMEHLGEEAVGFSLFLDGGITSLVGFPFPGKVRLGSVPVVGFVDFAAPATPRQGVTRTAKKNPAA